MSDPLSTQQIEALIEQGIATFNQREFFEAHELLETAWRADSSQYKTLLQGIIQFSVGCYHATRRNWKGASTVLLRARKNLLPYLTTAYFVDTSQTLAQIDQLLTEISRVQVSGDSAEILHFPQILFRHPPD